MDTGSNPTATRRVLNALGVFGGVQIAGIICSVVRTKFAALWIGPVGVGLITLYNATIEFISTATQLNLRQSAVRDLSLAADGERRRRAATTRTLALILGLIGSALIAAGAPVLSRLTFGDGAHTADFLLLSPMALLSAVAAANWAVMQAFGQLKPLARSTLAATVIATAAAVPLLWYMRMGGIVPVLLAFSAANCLFSCLLSHPAPAFDTSLRRTWRDGRSIMSLGFYITVSAALTLGASYVFLVWLNRNATADDVGIYQAGYTLVNSYVGLLFTAISMEYYPRLSAVGTSPRRCAVVASHEIKVAMCVLLPVVPIFVALRPTMVQILYSPAFAPVESYLLFAAPGIVLRALSWCLAFVILARGDGRIYVVTELLSAAAYIALNIAAWNLGGFAALGTAYALWYAFYTIVCLAVFRYRYRMRPGRGIVPLCILTLAVALCALAADSLIASGAAAAVAILSAYPALRLLRKNSSPTTENKFA